MDKAIGKVLFIDEAYGLNPKHGGTATFMQEVRRLLLSGHRYGATGGCSTQSYDIARI